MTIFLYHMIVAWSWGVHDTLRIDAAIAAELAQKLY
jgi:hypothetical protein